MEHPSWADVYSAERDGLVRLAYLLIGSQQVAEDLVQDCFARVMARIRPDGNPGPYLRKSVVNACYSWHRKAWREVQTLTEDAPAPGPGGDPYESAIDMWDALRRLSPRKRTIVVLRYYLDMSEAEVASTLGCRVGTVKSTTHRALGDLRRMLDR